MIVVDTNVIAYLLIRGERTEAAEALLRSEPEWIAPPLWRSELRNVLVLCVRQRGMAAEHAAHLMAAAEALLHGREWAVASEDVLRLALGSGCSAYDCEFVALAEARDVPLVTNDRRLLQAFPHRARPLGPAAAEPPPAASPGPAATPP